MIDESTNISATGHLVIFATIVEEVLPVTVFIGLLQLDSSKNDIGPIFDYVVSQLQLWELDLYKFITFSSDEASSMVGCHTSVSTQLCTEVNPFLLACHSLCCSLY